MRRMHRLHSECTYTVNIDGYLLLISFNSLWFTSVLFKKYEIIVKVDLFFLSTSILNTILQNILNVLIYLRIYVSVQSVINTRVLTYKTSS